MMMTLNHYQGNNKTLTDFTLNNWHTTFGINQLYSICLLNIKLKSSSMKTDLSTASFTLQMSPAHKSSISQTQAIGDKVTEFLKNSLQKLPMDTSQKLSSSSMSNSRAFFQSEVNYLIHLVKQTNVLYQEKDNELNQMKSKIKEYEEKMMRYEHQSKEETMIKLRQNDTKLSRQDVLSTKETKKDDTKTRKKGKQKEVTSSKQKIPRSINNSQISLFQFTIKSPDSEKKPSISSQQRLMRLETELACAQKLNQHLKEQVQIRQQRTSKFQARIRELEETQVRNTRELDALYSEKTRLQLDQKLLRFKFQTLQSQYNAAQDLFGKQSSTDKIIIENLRQVLRNLQATKSPKKRLRKQEQGYYSINKKMRQSGDSLSSQSDNSSVNGGCFERNLRQENELLRTQLIRAFDEKGAMKNELKKYQRLIEQMKKQQQQAMSQNGNQNDKNLDNSKIDLCENSFSSKKFKKNKASILIVENTEAKEREIARRHRMAGVMKQLEEVVNIVTGDNSQQSCIVTQQARPQVLQHITSRLKGYTAKRVALQTLLNKARQQVDQLRRQKHQLQLKGKQQVVQLRNFLNERSQNASQINSEDSTDQAFKGINIGQEVGRSLALKEKQYIDKINQQEREIVALTNRIISLEEVNQSFYKLTSQNPSSSNLNRSSRQNQLVLHSNYLTHQNHSPPYIENALEMSSLELLKQKFTEFYQNTIKELDYWQISTLRNVNSSVKKYPQVKSQVFQPSSRIPQIIQCNVLKISRQFKSIKDIQKETSPICIQQNSGNDSFVNHKMSRSFVSQDKKSETLEEMMSKRLQEFQQFSTDWIQKVVAKTPNNQDEHQSSVRIQDEAIKEQEVQCSRSQRINSAMTERPSGGWQNSFEIDMNEIDAKTESMTSQELIRERQLFIREEISYYLPKNDSLDNIMNKVNSKKSLHSFRF